MRPLFHTEIVLRKHHRAVFFQGKKSEQEETFYDEKTRKKERAMLQTTMTKWISSLLAKLRPRKGYARRLSRLKSSYSNLFYLKLNIFLILWTCNREK